MSTTVLETLTLPEQLMAFIHAGNGRPYESVEPAKVTAAAELAELVLQGYVRLEDDQLVADQPAMGRRPWMTTAVSELVGQPRPVRDWIRERRDALARQQQLGIEHGVLTFDRGRFLGFGYDKHEVVPEARQALMSALLAPSAAADPRLASLAQLMVKSNLHVRGGITRHERERLQEVAEAAADLPVPRLVVTAMHAAVGYAIYSTITSD